MTDSLSTPLMWAAILLCASQSAIFSGLNLAFFGVSRLRLEIEAATGDRSARRVLDLRSNPNRLLTTILWGNVGVNVLLTQLTDSMLAPLGAFFVSAIIITFLGEIGPQAYFSRHAKRMASLLSPILRIYQWLLLPLTLPTAKMLDWWLGGEELGYFRESGLEELLRRHASAKEAGDVGRLEGVGAANFLALDDLSLHDEGEPVHPRSILPIDFGVDGPVFPSFDASPDDPWLRRVAASGKRWVVLVDADEYPRLVLDSNYFLRRALLHEGRPDPLSFCHRPIVVDNPELDLGNAMLELRVEAQHAEDDVIDHDLILLWSEQRRIVTGADILGRLLRGVIERKPVEA